MTDDVWSLLRSTHEVQRMVDELRVSDAAGTTTPEQEREYRLCRAALDQRHLAAVEITGSDLQQARVDADTAASLLWKHDALYGSHRGPLPATHPSWKVSNLGDYVRQEADAAGLRPC
ncbi:hypothetical protein K388_06926 [Streptomyces sp. KhCrAH-43]|uniref:hypothetical protein n=1 Tax=unclassified Streptomyces TaxID=2593676 RepID=UPI00037ABD82|nr:MULTISPECIES: hypothetical protein [unclassified Streptomyces]MYS32917.1 hypothetical protein [Streptomyces sp. SID4920]MYX64292.1 hypothetical protein [Streptomyces sp. SID8373]RAJ48660.1 hypothetical protein K388_06926 [Streptomyces sp. KhCrAH-43]